MDRVRNEEVRRQDVREISKRVLSWYGHVVRMNEERLTKREGKAGVSGMNLRGRPRRGWLEGVERALGLRGM